MSKVKTFEEIKRVSETKGFLGYKYIRQRKFNRVKMRLRKVVPLDEVVGISSPDININPLR